MADQEIKLTPNATWFSAATMIATVGAAVSAAIALTWFLAMLTANQANLTAQLMEKNKIDEKQNQTLDDFKKETNDNFIAIIDALQKSSLSVRIEKKNNPAGLAAADPVPLNQSPAPVPPPAPPPQPASSPVPSSPSSPPTPPPQPGPPDHGPIWPPSLLMPYLVSQLPMKL